MPVYEFCCDECEKKFDIVATLQEKEAGLKPVCPHCGSSSVHQVFGRFTVIGGSKDDTDIDLPDVDEDYGAGADEEFGDEGMEGMDDLDEDLDEDAELD
ncbi:MAG: zinc ribbon domain-containing protein [candidate division WOR-3 bacterium]